MEKYRCKNCGAELDSQTGICPECGAALGPVLGEGIAHPTTNNIRTNDTNDKAQIFYGSDNGSFLWMLLGMLVPVGIILYLCFRRSKPKRAAAVLQGCAMAAFVILLFLAIHFFVPDF